MTNALRLTNFSRQAGLNKTRNQWVYESVDFRPINLGLFLRISIWWMSYREILALCNFWDLEKVALGK